MKMAVFWVVAPEDWYEFTIMSEVCTDSVMRVITLLMEAVQYMVLQPRRQPPSYSPP
jgi:hypothetical protein